MKLWIIHGYVKIIPIGIHVFQQVDTTIFVNVFELDMPVIRIHLLVSVEWLIGVHSERIDHKSTISIVASGVRFVRRSFFSMKSKTNRLDRREAAPRFILRPRNAHVLEGNNAEFDCRIIAVSPPVVSW